MKTTTTARSARLLAVALPTMGLLVSASTWAAESGGRKIEEVIVTAEKREASIQDTSISITAFTGEFMEDFGIRNQEDLQNFIPATTIQPYDATVRGVGRNFRALGGDPGVSTYMNGIYSEDLLTATAATFFDVERVEVLRGPQGTLFGRNAVGGAINILYREPTWEYEGSVKAIAGNLGQKEIYGAFSGPIIQDKLAGRITLARRDRDGVVDDIGPFNDDIDGLGTESYAAQLLFTPTDRISMKVRLNQLDIDRSFGGANGGGLTVLNEGGMNSRVTDTLTGGWRRVDPTNTDPANRLANDFFEPGAVTRTFDQIIDPMTGSGIVAQRMRAGIDPDTSPGNSLTGFLNAAAALDGFGVTTPETAAQYNNCVFGNGDIDGDDLCAATNGLNNEEFEQNGYQFETNFDVTDTFSIKYLFGYNELSYERTTDDDNTASAFIDRQFYVNHEANYRSHELQFLYELGPSVSVTSGIFFYNAEIDQRGDFYDTTDSTRFRTPYVDNTGLLAATVGFLNGLPGANNGTSGFAGDRVTLFSAREHCDAGGFAPGSGCERNSGVTTAVFGIPQGDTGGRELTVIHGDDTPGTDLLYTTETRREAFAAFTQFAWDINERFTLTVGGRYAVDKLKSEENLWRYSELDGLIEAFSGGALNVAQFNLLNGGLIDNGDNTYTPTEKVTNGLPVALSVYRGFNRTDKEFGWRINLDYNITDDAMVYISATRAHRSGGNNLVFFSSTFSYDPEELINYEVGYKTDWLDNTLQINGSFYYYDYASIHTVGTEVSGTGGLTTSVLPAPGARVIGVESEGTWLVNDNLTLGGNVSFTPSKYTESLLLADPSRAEVPPTLLGAVGLDPINLTEDIKGNQLLQVPEWKATVWAGYRFNLPTSFIDLRATWAYTGEVYYSPFERDEEKAEAYQRVDLRATWTSTEYNVTVAAFVNNVFDDIGNLQILREGEQEFFRHTSGTTVPRAYGIELSYNFGDY